MADGWLPDHVPEDIEAEAGLLATLAQPGADRIASMLIPALSVDDFCHPKHQKFFLGLKQVVGNHEEISVYSIKAALESQGSFQGVGEFIGMMELLMNKDVENPRALMTRIQTKRKSREVIRLGAQLVRDGATEMEDPDTTITQAQDALHQISQSGRKIESESWMEVLTDMSTFEAFRTGRTDRGGCWGVPKLDDCCPIPSGEYVAIGARPGVGKTAFLGQIAITSAMNGFTPLIIQAELPRMTQRGRLASYMADLPMSRLKQGKYDPEHVAMCGHYREALARGRTLPISAGTPWGKIEAMIRYEIERNGVDLVLFDQFDKIGRDQVGRGSNEAYAFGKVSIGMMAITQETGIGMVVLAQIKGDADDREPTLADFSDTDRLAKDPGVVVHLYRNKQNEMKAKIQKNRDGSWVNYKIPLAFDGKRFTEIENESDTTRQSFAGIG